MASWRFEILSVSIYFSSACQMNIPQQVEISPNMYVFYPTRCILFHKMYSSQGLAAVFEISPLPAVLQCLSALCTSQLCCKYLHWINNIISVIHTRQWCYKYSHWIKNRTEVLWQPTQKPHRQAGASQLPCLYICSSNKTPAKKRT